MNISFHDMAAISATICCFVAAMRYILLLESKISSLSQRENDRWDTHGEIYRKDKEIYLKDKENLEQAYQYQKQKIADLYNLYNKRGVD